jgi:hypothetical protein
MRGFNVYVKTSCMLLCVGGNVAVVTGANRSARSKSGKDTQQSSKSSKDPILVSEVSTLVCCVLLLTCMRCISANPSSVRARQE